MTPTEEQLAIVERARSTTDNILLSALAGAAKTSTLVLIAEAIPDVQILCLAFNRRIADEMQTRLPMNCKAMTLNSLGHRTWGEATGRRIRIEASKTYDILKQLVDECPRGDKDILYENFAELLRIIDFGKSCGYVPTGHYERAKRLMDDDDFFNHIEQKLTDLEIGIVRLATEISLKQAFEGLCDYNDQILMPTVFHGAFPRYPLILIDEAQDLSNLNIATLKKLAKKRLIAVGDQNQCHPPGTLITLSGGEQVPIEDISMGDRLASLQLNNGWFGGITDDRGSVEVLDINITQCEEELVSLITKESFHRCTLEHKCLVKFNDNIKHCVYLMKRGNQFRVGTSKTLTEGGELRRQVGPVGRAHAEKADSVWILNVHKLKEEALIEEKVICALFGLPDVIFNCNSETSSISQENLDKVWKAVGDNTDRAEACLDSFGRRLEFPLWDKNSTEMISRRPFITQACNLISEVMDARLFDGNIRGNYWLPIEIRRVSYIGPVIGLEVSKNKGGKRLYLANNIVTHNSIYGFRGAHEASMEKLKDEFSMQEMHLSISFRCPRTIVRHSHWRAPTMRWPEWAKEGEVKFLTKWSADDLPESATIICRNNAPLFATAIKLLIAGRPVELHGRDVVAGLTKVMRKFGGSDLRQVDVLDKINLWEEQQKAKNKHRAHGSIEDRAECMRIFAQQGTTLGDALAYAQHLVQMHSPLKLMTGHRAKGLEFDHVFFLDNKLVGDDEQEPNLRYVIITRAKETLTYINSDDMVTQEKVDALANVG